VSKGSPNKETFCSYPFENLFLETDGKVKPCCAMEGSLGNIKEIPIKEIVDGPLIKEMRESICNGEWHPACIGCKTYESKGMESQRSQNALGRWDDLVDKITPDYFALKETDLRWSNTCNLSCTYCGPHFSSQWARVKNDYKWKNLPDTPDSMIDYMFTVHGDTYKSASLLGGEPLLLKPNLKLIEKAKDSEDFKFFVLSNFMSPMETNDIAQALLEFPQVQWQVSFECIGPRFEYVRHNGVWDIFEHNLRYIHERSGQKIRVFPTYCVYSALNLAEFYDYVLNSDIFDRNIGWTGLITPRALDIMEQKPHIKEEALKQLDLVLNNVDIGPKEPQHQLLLGFKKALEDRLCESGEDFTSFHAMTDRLLGKIKGPLTEDKLPSKKLWPILFR
tara:strand:+ start:5507 stop:6679 length:1173 start_codon:yes stop_codon:yes gene_type:complete